MADRKAVVKNADMSEDMQQDAIDISTQALEKFNIEKDTAVAYEARGDGDAAVAKTAVSEDVTEPEIYTSGKSQEDRSSDMTKVEPPTTVEFTRQRSSGLKFLGWT
jgi:hypothetical protein